MIYAAALFAFLFGYALGSIPFGLLLTKAAGAGDVRKIGSGNIGATNVLRTGRKGLAAATLLLDAFKGVAAVVLVLLVWRYLAPDPFTLSDVQRQDVALAGRYAIGASAIGAMFGHCFPLWLGFKGGKGVATFVGILFALFSLGGIVFAVVWLTTAYITRYSSLAALFAVGSAPVVAAIMNNLYIAGVLLVMAGLVFYRHRENITRLRNGTESRIGNRA